MTVYVYDKVLKRCVVKGTPRPSQSATVRTSDEVRFISQAAPPNLGRGTAYAAPQYVDGQPAFTSRAQAERFASANGMVCDPDRPTPNELRTELQTRTARRAAQRAGSRRTW